MTERESSGVRMAKLPPSGAMIPEQLNRTSVGDWPIESSAGCIRLISDKPVPQLIKNLVDDTNLGYLNTSPHSSSNWPHSFSRELPDRLPATPPRSPEALVLAVAGAD